MDLAALLTDQAMPPLSLPKPKAQIPRYNSSLLPPAPHLLHSPWTRISLASCHHHHPDPSQHHPRADLGVQGQKAEWQWELPSSSREKPPHKQQERHQGQGSHSHAPPAPASAENEMKVQDAFQSPLEDGVGEEKIPHCSCSKTHELAYKENYLL